MYVKTQTLFTVGIIISLSIKLILQLTKIVTQLHYIRTQYTLHTRFLSLVADYDVQSVSLHIETYFVW